MIRAMTCFYAVALSAVAACGGSDTGGSFSAITTAFAGDSPPEEARMDPAEVKRWDALAALPPEGGPLRTTQMILRVDEMPVPVLGADGRYHTLYEIDIENVSGDGLSVNRLDVLDARNGTMIESLDAAEVGRRLVVRDRAAVPGQLGAAQSGRLYMQLEFADRRAVPPVIDHRVWLTQRSLPDSFTAARLRLAEVSDLVLDSPLRGAGYIAGDGCCSSTRHIRATLAVNGKAYTSQRYAIDWELLDTQGRIYAGDPKDPASYFIYGKPVYAVADAKVITAFEGVPDTPPGGLPENMPLTDVDGNHVVLDLGDGRYGLYAHLKPGSVRVRAGETVRRGQVLGLVGTSGNSSEPHLHFHVMDNPSPLAANGLPYRLRKFSSTRRGISTDAFDQAIIDGRPIPTEPVAGAPLRSRALPLDLWIVDFPE
jgi:hypothetical protein